ncbi:MAG: ribonuclease Y [Patescibacteria group bacterium]|jgi:ribonuclease Y
MDALIYVLIAVLSGSGVLLFSKVKNKKVVDQKEAAPVVAVAVPAAVENESVVIEAKTAAKEIVVEAKDEALKITTEATQKAKEILGRTEEAEKNVAVDKAQLEAKARDIEEKARSLKLIKESIEKKQLDVDDLFRQQKEKLEQVSSLTKEEARNLLLERFDKELVDEKGRRIKEMEERISKDSDLKAQEILMDALKFGATDYIVDYTTSRVKIPDDEIKGRIIGKAGRNIMSFEKLTGVELDLDSTPGEIIVSSFDPVRREIARLALERLITDGRIQPVRIEDIVEATKKEVDHIIFKEGDGLCHRLGVYNLPKEVVETLGRFKFRFSYGQNMTKHTLEVVKIGVAIAHELKANVEVVKMGCLLHDIGKVLNDEEGNHIQIGVDYLRKQNIADEVMACVAEHHEDKPYSSLESAIVGLADHISGARPSARSEDYESFAKRMKDLETAALSFDGVESAYAISAGREVRVFVKPERVDDASTALLAREIAKKIELEQNYPGVVKVTVIRETKVSETAK